QALARAGGVNRSLAASRCIPRLPLERPALPAYIERTKRDRLRSSAMARKSARKSAARPAARASKSERERIIDAFMALLAEKPIERIGFAEIATAAGVSLADLRATFPSTLAILAAHMKEVDRAVLAGGDADMAEEPPRERLFDVLMRRLEVLAPHK